MPGAAELSAHPHTDQGPVVEAHAGTWADSSDEEDDNHPERVVIGPDGVAYRPGGFPHKLHRAAAPTLQMFRDSPHGQVVATGNPMCKGQVLGGNADPAIPVAINGGPVTVENSLFKGVFAIHIAGLPTTQQGLFDGKKRLVHVAMQGKFKRPVAAADLVVGQEFVKPLPPSIKTVAEVVLSLASRVFSSSSQVFIGSRPHFYNPLLATCQLLNVSREGEQPDLMAAQEDARLLGPALAAKDGSPLDADKRRKFFDNAANIEGITIDREHVWTFHSWQHLMNFSDYKLHLARFVSMDSASWLHGQPLQIMAKDKKMNEYSFNVLVWHERLLYGQDDSNAASQRASLISKISSMRSGLLGMISGTRS